MFVYLTIYLLYAFYVLGTIFTNLILPCLEGYSEQYI